MIFFCLLLGVLRNSRNPIVFVSIVVTNSLLRTLILKGQNRSVCVCVAVLILCWERWNNVDHSVQWMEFADSFFIYYPSIGNNKTLGYIGGSSRIWLSYIKHALLDYACGKLQLWDIVIPLLSGRDLIPECCNVSVTSSTTIPTHSEMLRCCWKYHCTQLDSTTTRLYQIHRCDLLMFSRKSISGVSVIG